MNTTMAHSEYEHMALLEESMWWYTGLHANVLNALARYTPNATHLLDAGCGTGGMLKRIGERFPNMQLHGLDLSEQACTAARAKVRASIAQGSVDALPYPERSFDALVDLDVLGYDLDVDAAVAGFFRVLRPGGHGIINLAAYQWMLSYHDKAVGQTRRYTRTEGRRLFERHGFKVVHATYWNTVLFPIMVLQRKLAPSDGKSDVRTFAGPLDMFFRSCLRLERWFIERGIPLPFGGSVLLIVQRPLE